MDQKETLSVFGLGKLGATMLACFAHKGWNVIGVDVLRENVNSINNGHSPIYEPHVDDLIGIHKDKIQATIETEYAVLNSDASFIIVPTPSQSNGLFSTAYVETVCKDIAKALKIKNAYHLIIITSTVLMGDTQKIGAMIEEISGKKITEDFGLIYNPDFIALGKIVHDFLNPDMILIGESDERAGDLIEAIHKRLTNNEPPIHRMNFYNAELAKISLNAYCTLKITFANTIAEICEQLPGGDAEKVLKAIGSDSRIGNKYFRGGLAYSGPCFPRDCRAFSSSAKKYGIHMLFSSRTDEINNYHKTTRLCKLLTNILEEKKTDELAILGLSYKENTPVIEESVSIEVAKLLSMDGIKITVYDPAAMEEAEKEFRNEYENIFFADSEYSCLKEKSVGFIATPWDQFKKLEARHLLETMAKDPIILDAWGILPFQRIFYNDSALNVRRIGRSIIKE